MGQQDLMAHPNVVERELISRYEALNSDPRRARAFEAFTATGLPHRRMEAWKWTDFKARLKTLENKPEAADDPFEVLEGHAVTFSGPEVTGLDGLPKGVRAISKSDGVAIGAADGAPLAAITAALADRTILFEVTDVVETPLKLVFKGAGAMMFARAVFMLRPGASLQILESQLGGAAFNTALVDITVQKGASLRRTLIQPSALGAALASTSDVRLDEGARYAQTALAFGADIARFETRLTHQETGAVATLNAAYLAGPRHHVDFTSVIRHGAVACQTRQRTKGAVLDGGESVFQGKFLVPRGVGQQTDADMQHNALLLEDGAVVNAKPELEIYADDVECAHGNTCGALDSEQLFYMRQRGIPETVAKALLTEAFISETLEGAHHGAEPIMREAVQSWLSA